MCDRGRAQTRSDIIILYKSKGINGCRVYRRLSDAKATSGGGGGIKKKKKNNNLLNPFPQGLE